MYSSKTVTIGLIVNISETSSISFFALSFLEVPGTCRSGTGVDLFFCRRLDLWLGEELISGQLSVSVVENTLNIDKIINIKS